LCTTWMLKSDTILTMSALTAICAVNAYTIPARGRGGSVR
jgi:hypothetical protein